MIKVYFTAATSYNGDLHEFKKSIVKQIEKSEVQLTSGKQIVDKNLLEKDSLLTKEHIYHRESRYIEEADCIIAEVSKPSLGVGSEITSALAKKKSVLALVNDDYSEKLSPILAGNPAENLFIEYYNNDNLSLKIKHFFRYINAIKNRKGKLIVIDGGDGSGKETQVKLLTSFFEKEHKPYKVIDFPRYYTSFHGKTVAQFLRGEFGALDEVSPYLASLAYALDRASMKEEIELDLEKGNLIVANRYATSSMAHQGSRFSTKMEQNKFLKWQYELEYNVHRIPKEDLVIYLYVPWKIGLELTKKKTDRNYLKGKEDILEKDIRHRIATENMYLELTANNKHWIKVDCVVNGTLLPKEIINRKILDILKKKAII